MSKIQHILIVDDEKEICALMQDEFERLGMTATTALGGVAASQLLEQQKFDLIISDVNMAHGDGLQLLMSVKISPTNSNTPFYLMSGYAPISEEKAQELGASGILEKPIFVDDILKRFHSDQKNGPVLETDIAS